MIPLLDRSIVSRLPNRYANDMITQESPPQESLQFYFTRETLMKKTKTKRDYDARFERGMQVLKKMGRENLMLNQKALCPEMYEMSVGHLFGDVWGRPGLSLRERQLVTLAANIALARPAGTHSHYRSAQRLGITKEQIMEIIIHVGHYAGWPAIAHAIIQFEQVLKEDAEKARNEGKETP
jgi:4-carboxymuconolactone decarboxylase